MQHLLVSLPGMPPAVLLLPDVADEPDQIEALRSRHSEFQSDNVDKLDEEYDRSSFALDSFTLSSLSPLLPPPVPPPLSQVAS